jgi:hypothetical protein
MATVQFDHRILAIVTLIAIVVYWVQIRKSELSARVMKGVNALLHTAVLQVVLGIVTLLLVVPVSLGAIHLFSYGPLGAAREYRNRTKGQSAIDELIYSELSGRTGAEARLKGGSEPYVSYCGLYPLVGSPRCESI